jgi:hypothetical protein
LYHFFWLCLEIRSPQSQWLSRDTKLGQTNGCSFFQLCVESSHKEFTAKVDQRETHIAVVLNIFSDLCYNSP